MSTESTPAVAEQQQPSEEQQRMEEWCSKGLGDRPYIGTKEQYDKLSPIAQAEIIAQHPAHVEYLTGDPSKLPAELRLRMAKQQLDFNDRDYLQDAGFHAAVKFLDQRRHEYRQAVLEESIRQQQEETAARTKAVQEESAKAQVALQAKANASARAQYIRQLHSGSSVEQPTGPVTIGR